jgi:Vitamin K epoxide reductase family
MHHLRTKLIPVGASTGADWSSALADHVETAKAAEASSIRKVQLMPYVMLVLALVGVADAFYVAHASYTGQPLRELIIEGANTVLNSPYARIFGMPLSYFGLVYYSYMFGLAALLAFDPSSRGLRFGALLYTAMGVLSSIYFMYIQLNFIQAVCVYCLFSAVTTLLLLIAALAHFKATHMVR